MTDKTKVIENLISGDVFCNASVMVSDLTREGSHWAEHLIDCCAGPADYSEPPEGYTVAIEGRDGDGEPVEWSFANADMSTLEDGHDSEQDAIRAAWEDSGDEPGYQEVFEHWLVSDRLAEELESVGAPVARDVLGFNIWGRCETGQSLTMDHHLSLVADLISKRVSETTGRAQ